MRRDLLLVIPSIVSRTAIPSKMLVIRQKGYNVSKGGKAWTGNFGERRLPGSARVSRVGFGVSPKRSLKVREIETVSPARETRALPGSLRSPEQLECAGPI